MSIVSSWKNDRSAEGCSKVVLAVTRWIRNEGAWEETSGEPIAAINNIVPPIGVKTAVNFIRTGARQKRKLAAGGESP